MCHSHIRIDILVIYILIFDHITQLWTELSVFLCLCLKFACSIAVLGIECHIFQNDLPLKMTLRTSICHPDKRSIIICFC